MTALRQHLETIAVEKIHQLYEQKQTIPERAAALDGYITLDAVVLGPRLAIGSRVQVNDCGAVGLSERFMYDDKLLCADKPITAADRRKLLLFFKAYAVCKGVLNLARHQSGHSRCEGWGDAPATIARAVPIENSYGQPRVGF